MPTAPLPIANGQYLSDSLPVSAQECVNWYPVIEGAPSLNQETLRGTPGIREVYSTGDDITEANRGFIQALGGRGYFVNGNGLYRLNLDETVDSLGTISGTGHVSMAVSETQLMIVVPGGDGYIFERSPDTLTQITDVDYTTTHGTPMAVVFVDGYFLCTSNTKKFKISAINDGLTWDPLDYGSAESNPDNSRAAIIFRNQLFIAGAWTMEAFTNVGGADFPFVRSGLFLDKGVSGRYAWVVASGTFIFMGFGATDHVSVWRYENNSAVSISTKAIDAIISRLTADELSAVVAWAYGQNGSSFVGFTLPDTTIVYDLTSGRWHERKSRVLDDEGNWTSISWRAISPIYMSTKIYVGDSVSGRIGMLDTGLYKEYANNIVRTVSTQPFQNNMQPFFISELELTVESGVGNVDATDPVIMLDRSLDGGKTYQWSRMRPMGKEGEYSRRVVWRRLGRAARFDVYRFTLSDPVKPVIIQLTANIAGAQ